MHATRILFSGVAIMYHSNNNMVAAKPDSDNLIFCLCPQARIQHQVRATGVYVTS